MSWLPAEILITIANLCDPVSRGRLALSHAIIGDGETVVDSRVYKGAYAICAPAEYHPVWQRHLQIVRRPRGDFCHWAYHLIDETYVENRFIHFGIHIVGECKMLEKKGKHSHTFVRLDYFRDRPVAYRGCILPYSTNGLKVRMAGIAPQESFYDTSKVEEVSTFAVGVLTNPNDSTMVPFTSWGRAFSPLVFDKLKEGALDAVVELERLHTDIRDVVTSRLDALWSEFGDLTVRKLMARFPTIMEFESAEFSAILARAIRDLGPPMVTCRCGCPTPPKVTEYAEAAALFLAVGMDDNVRYVMEKSLRTQRWLTGQPANQPWNMSTRDGNVILNHLGCPGL